MILARMTPARMIPETTTDDGENWLKTSKIQFVYSKKPVEDAVVIGDQAYTSFEKALAAAHTGR